MACARWLFQLRETPCTTGDEGAISIGDNSNLQDNVSVRTSRAFLGGHNGATTIGNNVTVGHSVLLDCVTIDDEALIGMGATLLEGVKVSCSWMAISLRSPCLHLHVAQHIGALWCKMYPFHSSQGTMSYQNIIFC